MVICAMYMAHEVRARHIFRQGGRLRVTPGIRVSLALFTLSLGIFIRCAEVWLWRVGGGAPLDLNQTLLTVGSIIAIVGFLGAIRELSLRLFGRAPWIWTLLAMVFFSAISVALHFR